MRQGLSPPRNGGLLPVRIFLALVCLPICCCCCDPHSLLIVVCCLWHFQGPARLFRCCIFPEQNCRLLTVPQNGVSNPTRLFSCFLPCSVHFRVDCCVWVPLWYSWASEAHFLRHVSCVSQEVETLLLCLVMVFFFLYSTVDSKKY